MLETFRVDTIDTPIIIFMVLFSSAFGIFYFLVLNGIYKITVKPGWPLFAVPPAVVLITAFFDPGYVLFACLVNFPLLLLLMIFGGIYKSIRKKESLLGIFLFLLGMPLIMLTWPWGIFLLFAVPLFLDIVKPSKKNIFYDLQGTLATSKVRSMAMGLVEISGKTRMLDPVISRIKKEPCIGYVYKIDTISRDKDGKKSYTNISMETQCNTFEIADDTGTATIKGEDISILNFPESEHSYESNSRRYQLFLLKEGMDVLLVGKATNRGQQVFIEKEPSKDIFAIAPFDYVQRWNVLRPLRNSLIRHFIFLIAIISIILLCDIDISGEKVIVRFTSLFKAFDLKQFLPFEF
ncbi:Conserved hypothetical membrane protein [Zobellia galactanivorans]|uniref:Conserved hypothetical membrane protein n=2 Tax=Zobellia galactanivorans (strain DSM 12802 / CCUG 47099 / CIP 106680 / NCIMB 13871 / Dsij) TaxID=63186 RepID=G0L0X2_ZOBGA|nr:Conserved hypothetical membrane protein [Zobellia galactanivorans]